MVQDNPFNDYEGGFGGKSSKVPAAAGAWEPDQEVALDDTNGTSVPAASSDKDVKKREKELKRREKELAKKEEELRRREEQLAAAGGAVAAQVKNWPRCYPIIHHDIDADIPEDFRRAVKAGWITLWAFFVASVLNFVGALVALIAIGTKEDRLPGMFLALIYLVAGVPLAYVVWYRTLYNSAQRDRAFGFAWFFLTFLAFMVFVVWSLVGPDILVSQWSHTGVLSTIEAFDLNTAAGIMYIIGTIGWGVVLLLCLVVMKMVYTRFRGRPPPAATLKQEMVQSMVSRNMV